VVTLSKERSAVWFFYLLLAATIGGIFFTHPFFLFPFDTYIHLSWIEKQDLAGDHIQRETWHWIWANLFHLLHLEHASIFQKGYMIHYTQITAVFLMIFYFSRNLFAYLFKEIPPLHVNYLAYWSTLLWFTILSTYSAYSHEVWIVWYSVTYQITLPLILFALGIFISVLYNKAQSNLIKTIKVFIIFSILFIVLNLHPMELFYFILYIAIFMLIYIRTLFRQIKRVGYWIIPLVGAAIFLLIHLPELLNTFAYREILLFRYLSPEKLPQLYSDILAYGTKVTSHLSRSERYMNELIYFNLLLIPLLTGSVIYRYMSKRTCRINIPLFSFVILASLLIFIPQNIYSAGIASILTYTSVVYRFAYSSLLFLILPISVYYLLTLANRQRVLWLNLAILSIWGALTCYAFYAPSASHNYAKNILSVAHMFTTQKRSFLLSETEIETIGEMLQKIEREHPSRKPILYYARPDIAYVIKHLYHRNAIEHIKPRKKSFIDYFNSHSDTAYTPVLFHTPKTFPPYRPYIPRSR
jgi:hypothetical protein